STKLSNRLISSFPIRSPRPSTRSCYSRAESRKTFRRSCVPWRAGTRDKNDLWSPITINDRIAYDDTDLGRSRLVQKLARFMALGDDKVGGNAARTLVALLDHDDHGLRSKAGEVFRAM